MKREDGKDIVNQVIAGIVLFMIISAITYFGLWTIALGCLRNIFVWLNETSLISNWISVVLFLISFILIFKKAREGVKFDKEILGTCLEENEEKILVYLSKKEGAIVEWNGIRQYFSSIKETRLKYYVESLKRKNYLNYNIYVHEYSLGHPGRAYLIQNKLI
ncbi:MAG: hypothetical protein P9M12_02410 [Candidatus Aceula lacicola]|nr:hypothetical protein [Candidatus Aceula lacicola]